MLLVIKVDIDNLGPILAEYALFEAHFVVEVECDLNEAEDLYVAAHHRESIHHHLRGDRRYLEGVVVVIVLKEDPDCLI